MSNPFLTCDRYNPRLTATRYWQSKCCFSRHKRMSPNHAQGSPSEALPFLRWAGSKKQHLPFLQSFWSSRFSRYIEPFAGSAVLFFHLKPRHAILGDINKDLIETFKTVRAHPSRVHKALQSLPKGRNYYYKVRKINPSTLKPIARAARFIYLNRFCFNGLYRTNSKGHFNVPYGAFKSGALPTAQHLRSSAKQLKSATLRCADFRQTLAAVRKGDFIYLDPPYAVSTRRVFVEYSAKPFLVSDIADLETILERIDKSGATFVLSYADCPEARKAFAKWRTTRVLTRRNVAGFLGARKKEYELCVTNARLRNIA